MKNRILLIIVSLLFNTIIFAQQTPQQFPISISYYGHFGYQPGLKIGTTYTLKTWNTSKKEKMTNVHQIIISPQIGFFFHPKTSNNFVINTEVGYHSQKLDNTCYSILSIGVGYLAESLLVGLSTNIGNGSTTERDRQLNHIFMPTLNYELGGQLSPQKLGWFMKLSAGIRLFEPQGSSPIAFTEFGVKYYLK